MHAKLSAQWLSKILAVGILVVAASLAAMA
jgi:hypothetical protein